MLLAQAADAEPDHQNDGWDEGGVEDFRFYFEQASRGRAFDHIGHQSQNIIADRGDREALDCLLQAELQLRAAIDDGEQSNILS